MDAETDQTPTDAPTDAAFAPLLALLPVALQAVNLQPEQYPISIVDGKDGEPELHLKNAYQRPTRIVLQSPDVPPQYVLLVAAPPTFNAFRPYAARPYNVDAETLCCYLAHSLSPQPVGGGRAFSKAAVNQMVRAAIAAHRQQGQPDPQAAVRGGARRGPGRTDVVYGNQSQSQDSCGSEPNTQGD